MKRLAILLTASVLFFAPRNAAAVEASTGTEFDFELDYGMAEDPNDELLLLSPTIDGSSIGGSLPAYRRDGRLYLPLVAIAAAVEYNIKRSADGNRAAGWVGSEDSRFSLDATASTISHAQFFGRFDAVSVLVRNEDIFVQTDTLSRWLPLDFNVNTLRLSLEIKPREKTPYQLRKEREARLKLIRKASERPNYPIYANEYRLWDGPFINQSATGALVKHPQTPTRASANYGTYLAADLLYLEAHAFFSGNDEEPFSDFSAYAGRKDYYGRMLGPLQAREFSVGDIYGGGIPLVSMSERIRGASVSNYPFSRPSNGFSHTFQGDLPAGWLVELYQDTYLLDYRRADVTGRYSFNDVPLRAGNNTFTLVFYGPYGQKYEETQTYRLVDNLAPQGELYYRTSGGADLDGQGRGSVESDYGITDLLSLHTGLSTLSLSGARKNYATAGLRSAYGPVFLRTDLAGAAGASSWQSEAQTAVGPVSLSASHTRLFGNFVSEAFLSRGGLRHTTTARLDTSVPAWLVPSIYVGLAGSRDVYRDTTSEYRFSNLLAAMIEQVAVTNRIDWTVSRFFRFAQGGVSLSRRVKPLADVRLSGDFQYVLSPESRPRSFGLAAERNLLFGMLAHAGFRREFRGASLVETGLSKEFGDFGAGVSFRSYYQGRREAFLQLTYGFGFVPQQREVYSGANMASTGAILVKAFYDENQNQRWDAGEPAVQNAQVMLDGAASNFRTGRDGAAFVTTANRYSPIAVSITQARNEETPWLPTVEGYTIVPRPGRTATLTFPVLPIGEVDGTVFLAAGAFRSEQAGVKVELVDIKTGDVVKSVVAAYDGYFYLNEIRPGTYKLRVAIEDAKFLEVPAPEEREIKFTPASMVYYGQDLTLQKR